MRVVRAVRAGEAKLRGRIQTVILIAGPSGCEYPGGLCLRAPFRLVFVHRRMGFNTFYCFLCPFACFLLVFTWVLRL